MFPKCRGEQTEFPKCRGEQTECFQNVKEVNCIQYINFSKSRGARAHLGGSNVPAPCK